MHLITVNEVLVVSSAAKEQTCSAHGHFTVILSRLLTLLHESNKGNHASARTNHEHWHVVSSRHREVRVFDEAHHLGLDWLIRCLLTLLEDALKVARDKTVPGDFSAITLANFISGERNSDHQLLRVSQGRRSDGVVSGHDKVALLKDEASCEVERRYHRLDVNEAQVTLLEQLIVLFASCRDDRFK